VLGAALVTTSGCGESGSSGGNSGGSAGAGGSAGKAGTAGMAGAQEMPDDVAGDYTVGLVNVQNSCPTMAEGWTDGAKNDGVDFLITQEGVNVSAETMGGPALYFLLLTGANEFTGEIHGSHFVLTNYGTKDYRYETCDYTINAVVEGDLDGDTIAGTVTYRPVIKPSPDCEGYDCSAEQAFSGTRPPN